MASWREPDSQSPETAVVLTSILWIGPDFARPLMAEFQGRGIIAGEFPARRRRAKKEARQLGIDDKNGSSGNGENIIWAVQDLNLRPPACKTDALPLS
jgi:hypothetical protein